MKVIPLEKAISLLARGRVGVLATDTVYGLVARADDPTAVARLYSLKQRERKPGTIIAADIEQLVHLGFGASYVQKVAQWWPNPLSVIVPAGNELAYLHQGLDSLPLRVPGDPAFRKVLSRTGPLVSSSANQPGEPVATTIKEAYFYFKDAVDFYVDGGDLSGREASTIIRLTQDGTVELLRAGTFAAKKDWTYLMQKRAPTPNGYSAERQE